MANKIINCKTCGAEIAKNAKVCPSCGAKNKRGRKKWIFLIVILLIVVAFFVIVLGGGDSQRIDSKSTSNEQSVTLSAAELKEKCEEYSYKEIARNPDSYSGKYAKFKGEVEQVVQEESSSDYAVYRVNITYDDYWTDAIMVVFEGELADGSRLIEEDIIQMYGVLDGSYTYESVFGSSVTVPLFRAKYIDRAD